MTYNVQAFKNQGRILTDVTKTAEENGRGTEISDSPLVTFSPREYIEVGLDTLDEPIEVHSYEISQTTASRLSDWVTLRIRDYANVNAEESPINKIYELDTEEQDVLDRAESFGRTLLEMTSATHEDHLFHDGLTTRQIFWAQHIFANALVEVFSSLGFSAFANYSIHVSTVGSYINITEPQGDIEEMFALNNLPAAIPKITKSPEGDHFTLYIPIGL